MGRRVRFYLRTWLEVKTEEHQSGICLAGTVQRTFLLNSCPLVKTSVCQKIPLLHNINNIKRVIFMR